MTPRSHQTFAASLLFLAALVAAAAVLRAPFMQRNYWNIDEGVTFTAAQQILAGDVLYRDAVDHRGPLVPYLKAAAFALTGNQGVVRVRWMFVLGLGLLAWGLYALARQLGDPVAGAFAAVVFTVLAFLAPGSLDTLALHTEWFVVAFSLLGFWVFACSHHRRGLGRGVAIGFCFGLAALAKQPGILDLGVVWVLLALLAWSGPSAARRRLLRLFVGTVVGAALPFAVACAYFSAHGAFDAFLYYGWTYNTTIYVPEVPFTTRLLGARLPFLVAWFDAPFALELGVAGAIGLLIQVWRRRPRADAHAAFPLLPWLILGWTAAGIVSCTLSGREFAHYAIHAVPGISLASGWILARGWEQFHRSASLLRRFIIAAVGLALAAQTSQALRQFGSRINPAPDSGTPFLRTFVDDTLSPTDRLFVWGYAPELYGLADRLPATRFLYSNFLTGLVPWTNLDVDTDTSYAIVPHAWAQLQDDWEASPPPMVIGSHRAYYGKYPLLDQPWLGDEIADHYVEVASSLPDLDDLTFHVRRDEAIPPEHRLNDAQLDPSFARFTTQRTGTGANARVRAEIALPPGTTRLVWQLTPDSVATVDLPDHFTARAAVHFSLDRLQSSGGDAVTFFAVGRDGRIRRSPALSLTSNLNLPPTFFARSPVLVFGDKSLGNGAAPGWARETREGVDGWTTDTDFTLRFPHPRMMDRVRLMWQGASAPRLAWISPNGEAEPLPLTPAENAPAIFTAQFEQRVDGELQLSSAGGSVWIGQFEGAALGPALRRGHDRIPPVASNTGVGDHPGQGGDDIWFLHAPALLHYPLPSGSTGVVFEFGFSDGAFLTPSDPPTTGARFELHHVSADGVDDTLWSRYLDPVRIEADRGLQTAAVPLNHRPGGQLRIVITAGQDDSRTGDWTYLRHIRIQGPGPDLILSNGTILTPTEGIGSDGESIKSRNMQGAWIAHAPSRLVYEVPAELDAVAIRYGLDAGAYAGPSPSSATDGIDVIAEFDDGRSVTSLTRVALRPFNNALDRGDQETTVRLPPGHGPGRLIVRSTPGPRGDPSFDWAYWLPFSGTVLPPDSAPPTR